MNAQSKTVMDQLFALDMLQPSLESIFEYLKTIHAQCQASGEECLAVEDFFKPEDLEFWTQIYGKRPADVKIAPYADGLHIKQLLFSALVPFTCGITGSQVKTFKDRVLRAEWIMNNWLRENNPSQEESNARRKRLNKAAQERFKLRKEAEGKSSVELTPKQRHAIAVKTAYDEFRAACAERQKAVTYWGQVVAEKQKQWNELKAKDPTY